MSDDEAVETSVTRRVREAAQLATQAAQFYRQQIARLQEWVRRDALDARQRAEAQARYHAAWEHARKELEVVHDTEWWNTATPKQIGDVYGTAVIWRDYEDAAENAHDVIHMEVKDRYGIDLDALTREDVSTLVAARSEYQFDPGEEFPIDVPPDQDPPDPLIDNDHEVETPPAAVLGHEEQELKDRLGWMRIPQDPPNASASYQTQRRAQHRMRLRQRNPTVEV